MFRCKIGNGHDALFWSDNWTGLGALKDIFPSLFANEANKRCVVKDRLLSSLDHGFSWGWKSQASVELEKSSLNILASSIPPTTLNPISNDSWGWEDNFELELSMTSRQLCLGWSICVVQHSKRIVLLCLGGLGKGLDIDSGVGASPGLSSLLLMVFGYAIGCALGLPGCWLFHPFLGFVMHLVHPATSRSHFKEVESCGGIYSIL
ncbi:hypothetical protein E3N88_00613 [Mikania micrantha]|uniref:Reverse transcriptase zinc-binding domain-containing protein n=1 Tax=Mikania micrantha TaxID=192012 RepID=A0A5N6Q005_9ASTR|nr:hypothetical protein E3N88_00613 [Mikania micrantha]